MPLRHFFSYSALVIFAFLPFFAQAQSGTCPSIEGKIGVIIGGTGATTPAMSKCYSNSTDFLAVGLSDGARLVDCFAKQIDAQAPSPRKFIVVGHSSGAAHAEQVVQRVHDKSKVRLVLLEGIGSAQNQKGVETSCWYAKNGTKMGFNGPVMLDKRNCPGGARAINTPQCGSNSLCLHISLVNSNVPADVTRADVFRRGLENCKGNLEWLGNELTP